jgi:hypothetical protein
MKILRGTIIGAISFLILSWVIYGLLLGNFLASNSDPTVNRPMEDLVWWAAILTNLVLGLLFALVLNWSGAKRVVNGIKTGALLGLILALYIDLYFYSTSTIYNLTYVIVDVIVMAALSAIVGMLIVLTWGKDKTSV